MTTTSTPAGAAQLPPSTVRLARALVQDAKRRGTREDARIEEVARTQLPDDAKR